VMRCLVCKMVLWRQSKSANKPSRGASSPRPGGRMGPLFVAQSCPRAPPPVSKKPLKPRCVWFRLARFPSRAVVHLELARRQSSRTIADISMVCRIGTTHSPPASPPSRRVRVHEDTPRRPMLTRFKRSIIKSSSDSPLASCRLSACNCASSPHFA
jgi:hypothetical protein